MDLRGGVTGLLHFVIPLLSEAMDELTLSLCFSVWFLVVSGYRWLSLDCCIFCIPGFCPQNPVQYPICSTTLKSSEPLSSEILFLEPSLCRHDGLNYWSLVIHSTSASLLFLRSAEWNMKSQFSTTCPSPQQPAPSLGTVPIPSH